MKQERLTLLAQVTGAITTEQVVNQAVDVLEEVVTRQSLGEVVVFLTPIQLKTFKRLDLVGTEVMNCLIPGSKFMNAHNLLIPPKSETLEGNAA